MTHADKERLGDAIAELAAHLDAATHRLLVLIAEFDASGGWADQGALSCAHWLGWRIGLELGAAREHVRVARALRELPQIGEALRRGQVSYSKVRALTRVATPDVEGSLLAMARASTASQLERICRGYRRATTASTPEAEEDVRWFREGETGTGFVRFDIQVRTEEAALLRRALEVAAARAWSRDDVSAETRPAPCRRADALVAVLESYLSGASDGAPPVEIVLHVDAGATTLDDGTMLPEPTGERLACDATVVEVVENSRGNVLDVGRRRRSIPTLLRRALRLRDRGCRFPGCTNRRVDAHHVVSWSQGGATSLRNLVSLCRRHHTFVHDYGMRVDTGDDGVFRFLQRDGTAVPSCDERAGVEPDGATLLRARNGGLAIDAMTAYPEWDGKRPDYGVIVWSLIPAGAG